MCIQERWVNQGRPWSTQGRLKQPSPAPNHFYISREWSPCSRSLLCIVYFTSCTGPVLMRSLVDFLLAKRGLVIIIHSNSDTTWPEGSLLSLALLHLWLQLQSSCREVALGLFHITECDQFSLIASRLATRSLKKDTFIVFVSSPYRQDVLVIFNF